MSKRLRLVFFGSPSLAIHPLQELLSAPDLEVVSVVSQPDRPAGRGRRLQAPPVKDAALEAGLKVRQPRSIRKPQFAEWLRGEEPDLAVVVAYGKIFPPGLLNIPRFGCVNLHLSLLPKYRGAAPVNWALMKGEEITGITTMLMDEGMDTGPILLQKKVKILPGELAGDLGLRLASEGAPLLVKSIRDLAGGMLTPTPQDHDEATYAPIMKKEDGKVDWTLTASDIENRWRGLHPWPGLFSVLRDLHIKLLEVRAAQIELPPAEPGLIYKDRKRLYIACGEASWLELLRVQLAGRKAMDISNFLRGYRLNQGERLENV